jgi:hypothetical protein
MMARSEQATAEMDDFGLRYPIGRFTWNGRSSPDEREADIARIASLPDRLERALAGVTGDRLDTPYRPGGWTIRQVVHHLPDSHMHGYLRCKFALAENRPVIQPYSEAVWATLSDSRDTPPEVSLRLLRALHERWVTLCRGISDADFERMFFHPEHDRWISLEEMVASYAWHGDHHLAHITALAAREGWSDSNGA